ncbi:hypothetical protein Pmani_007845 [Petrolisthes manimaculis]|uniref:Uncharacterized protein n=1 Tax=Petrolisthes manimaculis TaxID=1843537 RepID=A0AAE1UKC3_9EUCA|nr:hypothetical protein Pmani_007845 [Petrolisthes manimaculis]
MWWGGWKRGNQLVEGWGRILTAGYWSGVILSKIIAMCVRIDTGTSLFSLHSLLHLVSTGHPGTTIGGNVVGTHNGRINPVATYCFIPGA